MHERSSAALAISNFLYKPFTLIKHLSFSRLHTPLKDAIAATRYIILIGVSLSLALPCLSESETSVLPEPKKQSNVDETLFLVRVLETLYELWPNDVADPNEFVGAASELRKDALKYQQHITTKNLDSDLGSRFGDVVSNLDEYIKFLTNLELIKKEATKQLNKDSFNSGYKGGFVGSTTYATLRQSDEVSSGDALVASVIAGGIAWAVDAWEKGEKRDLAEQQAVEAEARRLGDKLQKSLMQAQATVRGLAKKNNWSLSEFGWELSTEQYELISRLSKAGDINGLIAIADRQVTLRPRDPFVRIYRNNIKSSAPEKDTAVLLMLAKDSYNCITLIPADPIYDDIRLGCASAAAGLATEARVSEIYKGESPLGSTVTSKIAVLLWKKSIEYSPSDSDGSLRNHLALSLMCNNSLSEAQVKFSEIAPLCQKQPIFCFNYACLFSRIGKSNEALSWLKDAIDLGFNNFSTIKTAPYLQYIRESNTEAFIKLITPKYSWYVTDDWLWDDVVLKNESPFPLSNITFTVSLKKGYTEKKLDLQHDYLHPGETKVWVDVVAGAEGTWDSTSNASLSCDQTL